MQEIASALPHHDYSALAVQRLNQILGPKLAPLLNDPTLSEIMLNDDETLFCERHGVGMTKCGSIDPDRARALILTLASYTGITISNASPILSCELPGGIGRFEGLLPPLTRAPVFSIRRHGSLKLTLEDLVQEEALTPAQRAFLQQSLCTRRSIMVCGETGCGKTTLLNALLNELSSLAPKERIVTIEDTPELNLQLPNALSLFSSPSCSTSQLLRSTLRLRPDRIVMGEIRGPEALDLIDALSTGHDGGMATLHAGSTLQGLRRLCLLVSRHPEAPRLIEPTVAQALDLILVLKRRPKRHLESISCISGFEHDAFCFEELEI